MEFAARLSFKPALQIEEAHSKIAARLSFKPALHTKALEDSHVQKKGVRRAFAPALPREEVAARPAFEPVLRQKPLRPSTPKCSVGRPKISLAI